jgi:cellulose biosynthesis protein BcsQ
LHAQIAAFPDEWDAQLPVADTAALWGAFASRTVDPTSPYLIFAASSATAEQISGAIIAMLPTAKPFVLVDNVTQLLPYQQAVLSAASSARADASKVAWAATSYDLISVLRAHVDADRAAKENAYSVGDVTVSGFAVDPGPIGAIPDDLAFLDEPLPVQPAPAKPATAQPAAVRPAVTQPTPVQPAAQDSMPALQPFTPAQQPIAQQPVAQIPVTPVPQQQPSAPAPEPAQPIAHPAAQAQPTRLPQPSLAPLPQQTAAAQPQTPTAATPAPQAPTPRPPAATAQPRETVVGSPAAAHLPTLSVSATANPQTGADKTVVVPPKLPGQVTIAVTSSKGGSGKSTTALMLATTIAQSSRSAGQPLRVAILDLDARDGQVSTLIGTYLPTAFNLWSSPKWDADAISKAMVRADDLGVDCLLAPARPRASQGVGTEFYRHVIRMLQGMYDVVVLDTSANYLDPATWEVALLEASSILLVTTLANTAIQGMSRAVRDITDPTDVGGLGVPREHLSIVVNQSVAGVGIDMEFIVQAALHVPIVAAVPMATRDVLLATNHSAMQALLKHPFLGPAYYGLARAIVPQLNLVPLVSPAPDSAVNQEIPLPTVSDTSARETRSAASDELSSETAPSDGATVQTVSSVLGS